MKPADVKPSSYVDFSVKNNKLITLILKLVTEQGYPNINIFLHQIHLTNF